MLRAKSIADIINKELDLKIVFDKRLRERNFGVYQNKHKSNFDHKKFFSDQFYIEFSSVEKNSEMKERLLSFINDIKKEKYKNILVVTHGGIISQAKSIYNKNLEYEQTNNCEIFSMDF